ncbi:MAG: AzlC family ABC transporter permease [Spirochaetaceae bacterium]|jgi:4-azaleucine resistance transporter AzlC|nr:AzlC family ABC transporter permease [Spirochaetaceae bacterium]
MRPHVFAFKAALKTSLPVFFGYISIGFAFGFLLVKSGFHWLWAPLMCLVIFAGAAQFMAIGMLLQHKSPWEMGLAILLLNARHMVYGFSLLDRYSRFRRFKAYLIFGLTDETYGLLTTIDPPEGADPERFDFYVTALNHSYWTLGSTLGALTGSLISWNAPGIEFSMTALFTVLLVEQIRALKRPGPFLLALGVCMVLYFLGLQQHALLLGIIISAMGCFFLKREEPA